MRARRRRQRERAVGARPPRRADRARRAHRRPHRRGRAADVAVAAVAVAVVAVVAVVVVVDVVEAGILSRLLRALGGATTCKQPAARRRQPLHRHAVVVRVARVLPRDRSVARRLADEGAAAAHVGACAQPGGRVGAAGTRAELRDERARHRRAHEAQHGARAPRREQPARAAHHALHEGGAQRTAAH
eukprot:1646956-Prymnesium_polylepis.1